MEFIDPVYTRTQEDLKEIKSYQKIGYENLSEDQKYKWMSGMIGALNATDLNRIENNIMCLMFMISENYQIEGIKINWLMTDFVLKKDFLRIYNNMLTLMYNFGLERELPKQPFDTIEKLNKVEELLKKSYNIISEKKEMQSFRTNSLEYFKTVDGEYLEVTYNVLKSEFKTNSLENFKTSEDEQLVVFDIRG